MSHLKKYRRCSKFLSFDELNRLWFEKYLQFLKTKLNHSPGTRSNQIKNIKAVLNYAHELELHDNTKYQSIKKMNKKEFIQTFKKCFLFSTSS